MDADPLYTMQQAAQRKGVSYYTVSRAVRCGRLPSQRLGRMALIAASDLDAWQPMRERAPKRYRRREPDLTVAAAPLDQTAVDRARLEQTVIELLLAVGQTVDGLSVEELRTVHGCLTPLVARLQEVSAGEDIRGEEER